MRNCKTSFQNCLILKKNEAGEKANRFMKQLDRADAFIMLKINISILKKLEGANTVIQSKSLHLKTCTDIIDILKKTIYSIREKFNSVMWEDLKEEWKLLGLDEPKEPRKRKLPIRFNYGLTEPHIFTAKECYNKVYKEAIDFVLGGLASKFTSDSQLLLLNAESFLINLEVSPKTICDF